MAKRKLSYLDEAYLYQQEVLQRAMRARASRRLVMKASTLAALGGAGAVNALLAACGGGEAAQEVLEEATKVVEEKAKAYQYSRYAAVEQYHWKTLPWPETPYTGGYSISATIGATQRSFDIMTGSDTPPAAFFGQRLFSINIFGPNNLITEEAANLSKSQIVPELVELTTHNPDYTQWTVKIPQGVFFHDIEPVNGRELTAEDIKYCFERFIDTSIHAQGLGPVESIEVLDRYTTRFTLKYPYLLFNDMVSLPPYVIFAKEHFEGDEDHWKQQPILTGPFFMSFNEYLNRMEGEAFSRFYRKDKAGNTLPYMRGWKKIRIADPVARLASFRTNQTDHYIPGNPEELDDILNTNPETVVQVIPYWSSHPTHIIFQHKDPLFQDVRVRRALNMAIDRDLINEQIYQGWGVISRPMPYDMMGLDEPQSDEALGPYVKFDPTEAKRLLAEAGYADGLTIEHILSSPSTTNTLVQKFFKDVGVNLKFDETESSVYLTARNQKTFKHMVNMGNNGAYELDTWAQRAFSPGSVQNWGDVNDPVLTALIDKQHRSLDADERLRIASQMHDHLQEQMPHLYLVTRHIIEVWKPYVQGSVNGVNVKWDNRGEWAHMGMWIDDQAPEGRGGTKVV